MCNLYLDTCTSYTFKRLAYAQTFLRQTLHGETLSVGAFWTRYFKTGVDDGVLSYLDISNSTKVTTLCTYSS